MMVQALGFLLIGIVFSVTGELLLKRGMDLVGVLDLSPSAIVPMLFKTFTNPFILGGFVLLFTGSIFWLAVISRIPLSVAYPMLSLSYVAAVFLSALFFGEQLSFLRVGGVLVIMTGVVFVGLRYQSIQQQ